MSTKLHTLELEHSLKEVLEAVGIDCSNESTRDTPKRFLKYLREFVEPWDCAAILKDGFDAGGYKGMVVQSSIPFTAICEHHLLPMIGYASLGYIPNKRVLGLSKLARIVYHVAHEKPGLQEGFTDRIAQLLEEHLDPSGVIVMLEAHHSCMGARGVNTPGVVTATSSVRGVFRDVPSAREEFFRLVQQRQHP